MLRQLRMGLALVLGLLANLRPVLFPNIGIYLNDQRTLTVQTVQSITSRTRNPILRKGFGFLVVGFEALPLKASERLPLIRERASGPVESDTAYTSGTV